MPIETLREHLVELREEIAKLDAGDQSALAELQQLAETIERELNQEQALGDPVALMNELERSVSGFEASHPNLSAILNNMLLVLGSIGI